MSVYDQTQYKNIFNVQLPSITPIIDNASKKRLKPLLIKEQTEAEAVCKYALSQDYGLNNNMFLGIDVGGSTSDILIG
jgi:activator of 2-hydroxyglutaryl-CoA dehydratase